MCDSFACAALVIDFDAFFALAYFECRVGESVEGRTKRSIASRTKLARDDPGSIKKGSPLIVEMAVGHIKASEEVPDLGI